MRDADNTLISRVFLSQFRQNREVDGCRPLVFKEWPTLFANVPELRTEAVREAEPRCGDARPG